MAAVNWKSAVSGNWTTAADWSGGSVPAAGDDATIGIAGSYTVSVTTPIAVHSIAVSDLGATLAIADPGKTIFVTGGLSNSGTAEIDAPGAGGTALRIGGTLTNSGTLDIGNAGLGKAMAVIATGLASTGTIELTGGAAPATLDIAAAAPSTLGSGQFNQYNLSGDALLEFGGGGGITAIGKNVGLSLDGTWARVALSTATGSNSALTGLASNTGTFNLADGARLTTTVALDNAGNVDINSGSRLTVGGTLTNRRLLVIGDFGGTAATVVTAAGFVNDTTLELAGGSTAAALAELNITAAAPTSLARGVFELSGDALLAYASGGITSIDGAWLFLSGAQSRVSSGGKTGSNSALTGLASNTSQFRLADGAVLFTTVGLTNTGNIGVDAIGGNSGGSRLKVGGTLTNSSNLVIGNYQIGTPAGVGAAALSNTGTISVIEATLSVAQDFSNSESVYIDASSGANPGSGGSRLSVGGTLTNSGDLYIGNYAITKATTAIAAGLANTGTLDLTGATASAHSTELKITAAAPSTLAGNFDLAGDALLAYASGGIATIASGAELSLEGALSRVSSNGKASSNSALTGLAANAGTLNLADGAVVATTTGLVNTGVVDIDTASFIFFSGSGDAGGSSLIVGGTLSNIGSLEIGRTGLATASTVTAAGLVNTGTIFLTGGTAQAALDITAAAPATLATGTFGLSGDALLEFAGTSGITAIGSGASLSLNGVQSRVALSSASASNSALTGLASNSGTFSLEGGEALTTTGGFTNTGTFEVDAFGQGGSSLKIGGALTNSGSVGSLTIGNVGITAATTVTAAALANTNTGSIFLSGGTGTDTGTLNLAGASSDDGSMRIQGGGVLHLGNTLTVSNELTLEGGTVSGGTLAGSGTIETAFLETGTLNGVTIASGATFTANLASTLTVDGVVVDGSINGSGGATLDFAKTGTDSLTNISGFTTIGLANGGANTLTLADANFGIFSGAITVNDGNSGNTVSGSTLASADSIIVNAGTGADVLTGGAGNDVFFAGGDTTMIGNAGANQFVFSAPGASNTIKDFAASSTNELVFSNVGFNLGEPNPSTTPQALTAGLFVANTTGAFSTTTQRLAYDKTNGELFSSTNGSGGASHLVATLTGEPAINAATQLFFIA